MEIGSFIEMEFPKGQEFYPGSKDIARLNSGRAGIYHAARVLDCSTVFLPYYQCNSVREFLISNQLRVQFYSIDAEFTPLLDKIPSEAAIVIVNYFGIMSKKRLEKLASKFKRVIIDNSQAFFCKPIESCLNVYSPRKFIGVPDGAYVIGNNAHNYVDRYEQDFSSNTSQFLLQRIEYGCEGNAYAARMVNEERIAMSGSKKMSKLTYTILDGTNYDFIIKKRKQNFATACQLFCEINNLDAKMHYDNDCVPMVYPLVIEKDELLVKLLENKVFQGRWWSYLLHEVGKESFEHWLSRYVIPITIDQRYGKEELEFVADIIEKFLSDRS